jgi:hypothetical protein
MDRHDKFSAEVKETIDNNQGRPEQQSNSGSSSIAPMLHGRYLHIKPNIDVRPTDL